MPKTKSKTRKVYLTGRKSVRRSGYIARVKRSGYLSTTPASVGMAHWRSPFPNRKSCVLTYADTYTGTTGSSAGSFAGIQLKLNSLHDPQGTLTIVSNTQGTAGGHQPYYYDQIRPQYGKYIVTRTDVKVWICNQGYTVTMLRDNSDNAGVPSNFTLELERPNSSKVIYNGNGDIKSMRKTFIMNKLAGKSYQEYLADPNNYGGSATSADPTNFLYANIQSSSVDNYTGFACNLMVELRFHCVFLDPEEITQS